MKHYLKAVFTLITFALLSSTLVQAGHEEKMIIALKTGGSELVETDISELAIGESKTIETEDGKIIDVIRTPDGAEVYIDGELLEMGSGDGALHEEHLVKQHVEVICDSDEECDKNVFIMADGGDHDVEWITDGGDNIVIHKEIELSCTTDEENTECSEDMVWITEDGDVDLEELRKLHIDGEGEGHKVIIMKKHVATED
jgi:hypothetical protein